MIAPKLRFSEFKDEWFEKKLEEIATVERGKFSPRPRNDPKFYNGEMPFIQTGDVANCGIYLEKYTQTLNEEGIKVSKVFPKNSILITIAANIGDTAITRFPVACPDSLVAIQPLENIANTHFLNNLLELKKEYLDSQATQNAQKNINLQVLKPLELVIPNYQEQTKIAEFLSAVDDKISQLSRQLELLNQYKKGVMQKIFSQEIRFKNDNGEDFGEWVETSLNKISNHIGGTALESFVSLEADYKFISIGNYSTNGNYIDNGQRIELNNKTQAKLLNKDDLVMVLNDKTSTGDLIGSTLLIDRDNEYIYNQRSERIICNLDLVNPKFLWHYLNSFKMRDEIKKLAQGGTQIYINFSSVLGIGILLPLIQEQKKIAEFLTAIDERIDHTTAQLTHTKQWKKGLLQQMFV